MTGQKFSIAVLSGIVLPGILTGLVFFEQFQPRRAEAAFGGTVACTSSVNSVTVTGSAYGTSNGSLNFNVNWDTNFSCSDAQQSACYAAAGASVYASSDPNSNYSLVSSMCQVSPQGACGNTYDFNSYYTSGALVANTYYGIKVYGGVAILLQNPTCAAPSSQYASLDYYELGGSLYFDGNGT